MVKERYSKKEKQVLREATVQYAQAHGLSDNNFEWLFQRKFRGKNSYAVIAQALPQRNVESVRMCVARMYHPGNHKVRLIMIAARKLM